IVVDQGDADRVVIHAVEITVSLRCARGVEVTRARGATVAPVDAETRDYLISRIGDGANVQGVNRSFVNAIDPAERDQRLDIDDGVAEGCRRLGALNVGRGDRDRDRLRGLVGGWERPTPGSVGILRDRADAGGHRDGVVDVSVAEGSGIARRTVF